jgi:PEP-CTERM motif
MRNIVLTGAAALVAIGLTAGAASAAQVEFRFDSPLPGGGSNPLPSFSQGGVTATPTCSVNNPLSGTVCSVTQNSEGLGVTWNRPGIPDDTSHDIDGLFRTENLTITFSKNVRILRVDFERVTDIDQDLPFPLPDIHIHDESALIIDGVNKGFGHISSALGIAGATANCSGVDDGDSGTECEVDLSALNWSGTAFTFGGTGLDIDDGFRIESIVIEQIPEPMTLALFGSALIGLGVTRRRR